MSKHEVPAAVSESDTGTPTSAPPPPVVEQRRRSQFAPSELAHRYALIGVWIALIVVFSALRPDTFFTSANFESILGTQVVLVVVTLALLIPMTAGDFDLSITGTVGLSSMMVALLNVDSGWPIGIAILAALAAGVVIGLINGALIVYFELDSFIVTLGSGTILTGVILWISGSRTISGASQTLVQHVIVDSLFGIPVGFFYGIALCVVLWYVFDFTPLGRRLLFVGRGRSVSRLSGLRVGRLRLGAFVASGLISALAGVLSVGTSGAADPSSAASYLLPAFAAAFLGATTIKPGTFNPWGSVIAVYFLVTGITGLQILGVASFVQQLFYGGALIVAVLLSSLAQRRRLSA
jgi:ribose transport system permease protein